MVALYLIPGEGRGQDHEGEATFPPKMVCLWKVSLLQEALQAVQERAAPFPSGDPVWVGNSHVESKRCSEKGEKKGPEEKREAEEEEGGWG